MERLDGKVDAHAELGSLDWGNWVRSGRSQTHREAVKTVVQGHRPLVSWRLIPF